MSCTLTLLPHKVILAHLILAKLRSLYLTLKTARDIGDIAYHTRRESCYYDIVIHQTLFDLLKDHIEVDSGQERMLQNKHVLVQNSVCRFHQIPTTYDFTDLDYNPIPLIPPTAAHGTGYTAAHTHPHQTPYTVQYYQTDHGIHSRAIRPQGARLPIQPTHLEHTYTQLHRSRRNRHIRPAPTPGNLQ